MRLLDTRTLKLRSFFDDIPAYAILSHCWEEEEVILPDLDDLERARSKKGFKKIEHTCAQALEDGFTYCWIDTCCIDKSSSAELSEAINSMFAWYQGSRKCYAYLCDVDVLHDLAKSKWFTRAWTLQELLAPSSNQPNEKSGMDFFSRDWKCLGNKGSLSNTISEITGVAREYLEGLSLAEASISMRMSWAADRKATRAEDIAYSLLGIFDVNMPLLYGEGKLKAFRRLQEEIMKISEDETLFAWEGMAFGTEASSADALAQDPKDFSEARNLVPFTSNLPIPPYSMTHRGLRITLSLMRAYESRDDGASDLRRWMRPLRSPIMIWSDSSDDLLWGVLRCHVAHDYYNAVLMPLRRLSANSYQRDSSTNLALIPTNRLPESSKTEEIYIRNSRNPMLSNDARRRYGFLIRTLPPGFTVARVLPSDFWDPKSKIVQGDAEPSVNSDWHASIQFDVTTSVFDKSVSFFALLQCKPKDQSLGDHPQPQSFVCRQISSGTAHAFESFHYLPRLNVEPNQVDCFTDVSGGKHNHRLSAGTTLQQVFGQWMFVVDVVFATGSNTLEVPSRPEGRS